MAHRLGIIGGGNMGRAIVRGGIAAGLFTPQEVIVAEIDAHKRQEFTAMKCAVTADPPDVCDAEQIILAVKPQVFPEVARAISPLRDFRIVISIMAGWHTTKIREAIGPNARMIRVMPNVACQIGAGMTAIALGDGANPRDEALAMSLFGALGKTVLVEEEMMHAVTAVSGSGPAYVFALAEAMEEAGESLGFDRATARLLVAQTIYGAGRLLHDSGETASALRQAVTSPGGTTAAALQVMEQRQFKQMFIEALTAARDRGEELGR